MTSWRLMSKSSTTAANSRPGADAHWHTPPSTPVLPAQVPLRVRLQCRSLSLGANGVPTAARYDFSHSLLLQVVGTKRITLLPPSAQHRLHLYPYWHGSRQQSQLDWSAASLAFEQDEVAEEHHTAAHHAHKAHSMLWDYIVNHGLHEYLDLGDYTLQSGTVLNNAILAYKTQGTLNDAKDNAILFPHMWSGTSASMESFVGAGRPLDPDKYFIIFPGQFANGFSSSPSNTPAPQNGGAFPNVTITDDVIAQHRLRGLNLRW